jgi:hypothetical protein
MSELKCPFCNKPLQPTLRQSDEYWCENYDCSGTNIEWVGSKKLWQELIRTKKQLVTKCNQLEIAVDALKYIRRTNPISFHFEAIEKALREITALEQKDIK